MSTTTTIKVGVDLLTQAIVYAVNCLMQLAFRVEHGRVQGGHYMIDNQQEIEKALRVWMTEQTLEKVTFELYSPHTDKAYEDCVVELSYDADPKLEVAKPPVAQLEELFTRLEKLPADAQFRLVVTVAPGATVVPGWGPTTLRDLSGGVREEHAVGEKDGHGYGHISGKTTYIVSNWNGQADKPPPT
jgi:hypothetical protein